MYHSVTLPRSHQYGRCKPWQRFLRLNAVMALQLGQELLFVSVSGPRRAYVAVCFALRPQSFQMNLFPSSSIFVPDSLATSGELVRNNYKSLNAHL